MLGLMLCAGMAMAQSTNISSGLFQRQNLKHVYTDASGIVTTEAMSSNASWTVSNGQQTNQMNLLWSVKLDLLNNADKSYDLSGGMISNRFGNAITFTSVKYFKLAADTDNIGTITFGNRVAHWASWLGATNDSLTIRPGQQMEFWIPGTNSYTVTATTGDILYFTNNVARTNGLSIWVGGVGN